MGEPLQNEKRVVLPLNKKFYTMIKNGEKTVELRSKSSYWEKRLENATHLIFQCGFLSLS